MKKIAIAVGGLLILLFATLVYNVWRAGMVPVPAAPGPLETGRQQLHDQLEQSKKRESEIELQDWNSITLLRELIKAHQERIDKLGGNSQAAEIIAWDKESIARIEDRIADLVAKASAQPVAPDEDGSDGRPSTQSATEPMAVPRAGLSPKSPAASPGSAGKTTPAPKTPAAITPKIPPATTPKPPAMAPKAPVATPKPPATSTRQPAPATSPQAMNQ